MAGNQLQLQNLGTPPTDQTLVEGQSSSRISDTWRRWFIAVQNKINVLNAQLINFATAVFSSAGIISVNGSGQFSSSSLTSLLDSNFGNTQGSILYRGASGWAALGPGTSGQVLETQGSSANPIWATASGGGGSPINVTTQTGSSYTFQLTDAPAASSYRGWVNVNNGSANTVTIALDSSVNFPTGTEIWVAEEGAGQTTIEASSGVTITGPTITGTGQYSIGRITKMATNLWWCDGGIPFQNFHDPYYADVQFLLHGNGANNGTVITDQKGATWTANGACVTSTAQSKFNGSSISFNGTSGTDITTPYNSSYDRTNKDFTLEFWVYFNNVGSSTQAIVQINTDTSHSGFAEVAVSENTGQIYFLLETSAGSWTYSNGGTVTAGSWIFIAVQVASGTATVYINGNSAFTFSVGTSVTNSGQTIIGNSTASSQLFNGYLAEIRYTLGVARYSSNFTPPTGPFPNS